MEYENVIYLSTLHLGLFIIKTKWKIIRQILMMGYLGTKSKQWERLITIIICMHLLYAIALYHLDDPVYMHGLIYIIGIHQTSKNHPTKNITVKAYKHIIWIDVKICDLFI